METSDWVVVVGICLSLAIGVGALVQTKRIQRAQHRHALLKEIVQWAIDIHRWRSESRDVFATLPQATAAGIPPYVALYNHIVGVLDYLVGQSGRNHYVSALADRFDAPLRNAVKNLEMRLKAYEEFLESWAQQLKGKRDNVPGSNERADALADQMAKCANKVIEIASGIEATGDKI